MRNRNGLRDVWSDFQSALEQNVLPAVLPSLLSGGLLEQLFQTLFPRGVPVEFEIPRFVTVIPTVGVEATVCPAGGCSGQVTVQRMEIRHQPSSDPNVFQYLCTMYVSARTVAPLPIHAVGDITVDFNTARGARTQLAFTAPLTVAVNASQTIPNAVRIKPDLIPLPVGVWLGRISVLPGYGLEEADITLAGSGFVGGTLSSGINLFKAQLVTALQNELEFAMNRQVCTRYATSCLPEYTYRPATQPATGTPTSYFTPGNLLIGAGAIAIVFALLR